MKFDNRLYIQANGVDPILTASEHIAWCRDFMAEFAQHSPWQMPCSVSGRTARHGNLGIEADFSNFDAMCILAQSDSKDDGFRNVGSGGDNRLLPDSYSSIGFTSLFSDGFQTKKSKDRCTISVTSPAYLAGLNELSTLAFYCVAFEKGAVNEEWARGEVALKVLRFFLSRFRFCSDVNVTTSTLYKSFSRGQTLRGEHLTETGGPVIGPLHYFGNPAIVALLRDEPDMTPFGEGLLLKLTDDFTTVDTVEIDDRLHAIRAKLRNAGFKTLYQGIDRAQWGCGSESVLGDEQP
ncbi:hypothetical protein [Asaia bogorensis]|uniref:Uncharacterized protein n=1 Tax=Asaia bogorensis NBRC 16594 TaxID=1231624 RepID=A0AAN4U3T7_9PROT|nr:hypothetical protein [Asaia bogorensis]GBQ81312.1 hypothetical protein AA0311_2592 [Asaia bogorensis NBRC 16594]GEL54898.1 hypothetical protein ABO01nite_29050 [Asaia bogorensis NBRC 16594]